MFKISVIVRGFDPQISDMLVHIALPQFHCDILLHVHISNMTQGKVKA